MYFLIYLVPVESLFYLLGLPVQSLWLVSVIGLFLMPVINSAIPTTSIKQHVQLSLSVFFLITIFSYLYSSIFTEREAGIDIYVQSVFRNLLAVILGYVNFIFFRYFFFRYGQIKVFEGILVASFIVFVLSLAEVVITKDRATGFVFSEPSHLAEYIAFIVFPVLLIFVTLDKGKNNAKIFCVLIFSLLAFAATASGTGAIRLIFVAIGYLFFSQQKKYGLVLVFIIAMIGAYTFILADDSNYAKTMILNTLNSYESDGDQSASVIDRGVFFLIFDHFLSTEAFFGYGFGSEAGEYIKFIPVEFLSIISDVKQNGFSLSALSAKILVAAGIPGLVGYILFFWGILIYRSRKNEEGKKVTPILFAMLLYSFIGLPVYSDIYIWFWLAALDFSLNFNILSKK